MEEFRDIVLPDIGAGPHQVRVVQWLVDRGTEVVAGDRVLEVVSLGVVFSVSAPCSGVVTACLVAIDTLVQPGDRLGTIAVDAEDG